MWTQLNYPFVSLPFLSLLPFLILFSFTMLSAFGANPPEFPSLFMGDFRQPVPSYAADTGYMNAANATRASYAKGDQPTIVARLVVSARDIEVGMTHYPPPDAHSAPHTRLAPGMPLFAEKTPSNQCTVALSLPDLNARLFAKRGEHAYRCGQTIADNFRIMGVTSTTLDPMFGYSRESARSIYSQQTQIHANAVVDGTTPGVSAIGCNSLDVFGDDNLSGRAIDNKPIPCAGNTAGASVYLVLMPVSAAYVKGDSKRIMPTAAELTTLIRRTPTQPFTLDSDTQAPPVEDDLVAPPDGVAAAAPTPATLGLFAHRETPVSVQEKRFGAVPTPANALLSIGVGPGVAAVHDFPVCYQYVPFMSFSHQVPHAESFVAYAGAAAPFVKVYPFFTTSVDHSAVHGAPSTTPIGREIIHPPLPVVATIYTPTTQAVFEIQPV